MSVASSKSPYAQRRPNPSRPKPDAPIRPKRKQPEQAERERLKRCAGAIRAARCDYCGAPGGAMIQIWFGPFKLSKPRAACLECRRAKVKNRFRFVREGE